jgi:hypothetical protein
MANKINKWDLKRVAKLLGLEWSNETEKKLTSLTQPVTVSDSISSENNEGVDNDIVLSSPDPLPIMSEPEYTGFCIIETDNGRSFNVCKFKFNLTDVEICGKYDTESRAIFERGKLEANNRSEQFRKRRK